MRVSLIAAVARNGVIGRDHRLPWHLPADLRHFKSLTMGHHLVMGRKTFESVGALPGRITLVVSRRGVAPPLPPEVVVVASVEEALARAAAAGESEVFVAGGAEIYRAALQRVDRIYLTRVDAEVEGDAHFPELDLDRWTEIESRPFPADERHAHPYTFVLLERRTGGGRDGAPPA